MRRLSILLTVFLMLTVSDRAVYASLDAGREILDNGMIVLHSERKALPIVSVVVAVKAGSISEPYEKAGLANLTVELLSEGTKKRSSQDISNAIEFVGGSLNTSGSMDFVTISLTVLKKDIELGFDLLSDIIVNPSFSDAEVLRLKALFKSGIIHKKEDPGDIASKEFARRLYGTYPYGWPVEGTEESLDKISRDDIVRFYRSFYLPNNAIMAVTGDISREEFRSLIGKYFGAWEQKKTGNITLQEPAHGKSEETVRIQKNISQAHIILGHLGIKRDNPDYYALSVMNYILGGGGFASRLMDNIRDNKGLSYDVYSYFSSHKYAGSFQAGLQTKSESANIAIGELLKEIRRISTDEVSENELADAKSYLKGSFPLRIDSIAEIAGFLVNIEFFGLGLDYAERYPGLIDSVTRADVLRVARKYLDAEKYVLIVVGNIDKMDLRY